MDATEIESFCATAAQLVPQLMECGALLPAEREPDDDAVRQLRISAELAATCDHVARLTPPMPMPAQPRPTSVDAPS